MNENVLAFDVGGTNVRAALVSRRGEVLERAEGETATSSPDDFVTSLYEAGSIFLKSGVSAAGVAVPAVIEFERRIVSRSPNVSALDGCALGELIENRFQIPVVLDNDATAAMIGEHSAGAARGSENAVCITLGTGVGGGLVINGSVYRGVDGTAGEIGHINVEPDGHPCGCGSRGCLEQYASATAIVRIAREKLSGSAGSGLSGSDDITAKSVFDAAMKGDRIALDVFSVVGYYLGIAVADLVNVLNPETIVIAGGASNAWELFQPAMRDELKKRAFQQPAERVKIVRGKLGDNAGLVGAASLAFAYLDKRSAEART